LKKLRPYISWLLVLITAVITLACRVARQVVLPTRTRKGNLLSSLFVLFTGLVEQVISSAKTIAGMHREFHIPARLDTAWAFSRKWLRRGMLAAAWGLFILSSLEWTSARSTAGDPPATEQQENISSRATKKPVPASIGEETTQTTFRYHFSPPTCAGGPPMAVPRWLLLRRLCI
jgi:hypothetical protein